MLGEKKEFKVGDVITVKNCFTTYKITVTRVTKTQAICDVKRKDGAGYTAKFKKEYTTYGTDKCFLSPIPRIEYNFNEYSVTPKSE